jgi:hypothetical protein
MGNLKLTPGDKAYTWEEYVLRLRKQETKRKAAEVDRDIFFKEYEIKNARANSN